MINLKEKFDTSMIVHTTIMEVLETVLFIMNYEKKNRNETFKRIFSFKWID